MTAWVVLIAVLFGTVVLRLVGDDSFVDISIEVQKKRGSGEAIVSLCGRIVSAQRIETKRYPIRPASILYLGTFGVPRKRPLLTLGLIASRK